MKRLFVSLFLTATFAFAQELPIIMSPSPNAASLAQYVEIPVSAYTGLPNINIPLYTITTKDVGIPIGLSYHARGVKLAELASSYGMGWSLNAGGMITRQIRGNADDSGSGTGYLNQPWYDNFFTSETTRKAAYAAELNGEFDRMPDQFIFNFLGFSGKFMFDRDTKKPILNTFDDLKIETIGDPTRKIEGFVVTDTQGTRYYFGKSSSGITATEENNVARNYSFSYENGVSSFNPSSAGSINTWHLLEIVPLSNRRIQFSYETEYTTTYQRFEEVAARQGHDFVKTSYFSEIRNAQKKVSKIAFENGEVRFEYDFTREDLRGVNGDTPTALSSVSVYNNIGDRIKKFNFDYEHTTSTDSRNMINFFNINAPEAKKRIFLKSIREVGKDNSLLPPYQFTYDPQVLPSRFSTAHDKWGYYNGRNNGLFSVFAEAPSEVDGTRIDTLRVQAGLLKKIQYPTGGSAEYHYESNRAEFPDHLQGHIAFLQNNPLKKMYAHIDKDRAYFDEITENYSNPFTIGPGFVVSNPTIGGTISATVYLGGDECGDVESYDCGYLMRILNSDGSVYAILHDTFDNQTGNNIPRTVTIQPGDYILRAISNNDFEDPDDGNDDFGVQLEWEEYTDPEPYDIIYTGGNRIKETILTDEAGNTIKKNYEYTDQNGNTSGKVFSLPSYYAYDEVVLQDGTPITLYHHIMFRPANTLTLEQGNHGGYHYVTEYIGNKAENIGKTVYRFSTFYDDGQYFTPPYHLPDDNERKRGKPISITNYKFKDGAYIPVKRILNHYDFGAISNNTSTSKVVKLIVFYAIKNRRTGDIDINNIHNKYRTFRLNSSIVKLKETEVTEFYEYGDVIEHTSYYYDYDQHYQVKHTRTVDSENKKIVRKFMYPQDKPTPLAQAERQMVNNNQFDVIESTVFIDGNDNLEHDTHEVLMEKNINHYKQLSGNQVLPQTIETVKGTNTTGQKIIYRSYDDHSNPTELSRENGISISYIWGYDKKYPVAKVENATRSQIEALPGFGANFHTAAGGLTTTQENTLRSLPNVMVTTYTYDPLIGMTRMTDPKGYTTYYTYDDFNRLEFVKDAEGKLISENKYNYKGQ
ncbi:RHS repeat protein [Aquimarina sp. U1-2]|uniref:RHS repeat domain-containing protein n=1 Tax=Aquimarina sp. U1-2 TaxID=2823141 RepID=UPI001AECE288|nr:RHS repeat domain-containing protein [Aquimarina sp. U1-2]MBP2832609.1 RHS repeat protein [Aquimarina sp. U1-2]